ncbi:hypothetical protein pEaSNUABM8_00261 [Erwinia phage pEa_SNUABM_8]|nr:hypothetical protein pEaSNUABM8_00261 [Erwinia phage pEa_SNUABM_8]QVW55013.1 hypothetical protein pEaSNUABM4_00260 [Erwinia phage pEa_SNUABM_4]
MTNKLFFFTDCVYSAPMSPYYYGAAGARDLAHLHELIGTNKVDTVELGDTSFEGQITVGQSFREVEGRTFDEPRKAQVPVYRVKEGVDLTERRAKLVELLCQQYGWTPEAVIVHMDVMDRIPAEAASSNKEMWRGWVNVEMIPERMPMFITFEGNDEENFEPTGETVEYDYKVIVDRELTPLWHMVDLLEATGLDEFFSEAAYLCRKGTMSATPVDGWAEVTETYGNHEIKLWLNPDWKSLQEKLIAGLNEEVERQQAAKAAAGEVAPEADLPNIDE